MKQELYFAVLSLTLEEGLEQKQRIIERGAERRKERKEGMKKKEKFFQKKDSSCSSMGHDQDSEDIQHNI